jgi:glycosyltransferase involved in cell wall biosynthesis
LRINELSLQENVTLAGFVTEESLARVFQTSNALVFPSLIGPDNLPPLEAMSHGARIIVADIPGAREQFQEFAEYFNPNDKFELANIMLKLLADFGKTEDDKISKNDFLKIHSVENYIAGIIKEIELNSMVLRNIQG